MSPTIDPRCQVDGCSVQHQRAKEAEASAPEARVSNACATEKAYDPQAKGGAFIGGGSMAIGVPSRPSPGTVMVYAAGEVDALRARVDLLSENESRLARELVALRQQQDLFGQAFSQLSTQMETVRATAERFRVSFNKLVRALVAYGF